MENTFPISEVEIVRDSMGAWIHPALDNYVKKHLQGVEHLSDEQWAEMSTALNAKLSYVDFEGNADADLFDRFFVGEDVTALGDWHPNPPQHDPSWILIRISESEDGAFALWAKPN